MEILFHPIATTGVGTVFHRTKADLHVLLSNALHKQSKDSSDTSSLLDKLNDSVHELSEHFVNKTSSSLVLDVDAYTKKCVQLPLNYGNL